MAIVRDFVFAEDERTGEDGLAPVWFDNANAANGMTISHDLLEHFYGQTGPAEGECEALGAFLLLRLEQGRSRNPPEQQLGYEICEIARIALINQEIALPRRLSTRKLSDQHAWAERTIQLAVTRGFEMVLAECDGPAEREELRAELNAATRLSFIGWLRRGYRRALKRYRACDLYIIGNHFFDKIGNEVSRLLQSERLQRGDRVRISLNTRLLSIGIRVNGHCAYDFGYL
jgi:hypothetical protein